MAGDPSNNPGRLTPEPKRHRLPRSPGGRPRPPETRLRGAAREAKAASALPIPEGYGTFAGQEPSLPFPPRAPRFKGIEDVR